MQDREEENGYPRGKYTVSQGSEITVSSFLAYMTHAKFCGITWLSEASAIRAWFIHLQNEFHLQIIFLQLPNQLMSHSLQT